jgi:predicted PurR-regulated permease PerM
VNAQNSLQLIAFSIGEQTYGVDPVFDFVPGGGTPVIYADTTTAQCNVCHAPLVAQGESLWAKMPEEFNKLQTFLIRYKLMTHRVTLEEAVQNAPTGAGGNAVGTVLVAISSLIGGMFGLVTILILTFYLLIEANSMFEYLVRFVPAERRGDVAVAARQVVSKVSAWLRAQFVLAGVMGTFAAVGLGLMGVPYFYVIALVAAVGETIPIVGPVIGGLASVAVLVALLVGGALWGLVGAILAIPTAAILSVILEEIIANREVRIQRVK